MVANLVKIDIIGYIKQILFVAGLALMPSSLLSAGTETFATGSKIINMSPSAGQTTDVLKSYGLLYDLYRQSVHVKWVIKDGKAQTDTDFSHDGIDYNSSAFIIPAGYLDIPAISDLVTKWQSDGVTIDTATSEFNASVYATFTYMPNSVLDSDTSSIAQSYFDNAKVSSAAYSFKSVTDLGTCDDFYALPHADASWNAHKNLKSFVESGGYLWSAGHVGSGLENSLGSTPEENLTFLSVDGAVSYGDHGDGTPAYTNNYNSTGLYAPIMQFLGQIDDATTNGSEQVYIPKSAWRATTHVGVDDTAPDAILVYGPAYGVSSNGWVMYEAGHSHDKASDPDNIAAQRVFFNFWLLSGIQRATEITAHVDSIMRADDTYDINASTTDLSTSYRWRNTCNGGHDGVFTDPASSDATFTPEWSDTNYECIITVEATDSCGRRVFNSHPVAVTGYPKVNLSLEKIDSQDPVPVDTNFTYTLTVTNHGPSIATGYTVTDTLPNDVKYVSASEGTCSHSGDANGGTVTCLISGTIAVDGTHSIDITVTAPDSTTSFENHASVSADDNETDSSDNNASEQTTTADTTDLNISMTGTNIPVLVDTDTDFVIVAKNSGDRNSTQMVVEDYLPTDMSFVSHSGNGWSCIYSSSTHIVQCEQSGVVEVDATAPTLTITATASTVANLQNIVKLRDRVLADSNISDNTAEHNITTYDTNSTNLAAKKTVASPSIGKGNTAKFTITVTNNGPDVAHDINITDEYDTNSSGFDPDSYTPTNTETNNGGSTTNVQESNGTLVWNVTSLDPGGTVTIKYEIDRKDHNDANTYSTINRVGITAHGEYDPDESDNNDSVLIDATKSDADLSMTKVSSKDPAMEGIAFDYNLTVKNNGINSLPDINTSKVTKKPYIIGTLDSELEYNSVTVEAGDPWICDYNATAHAVECDWNTSVDTWDKDTEYNISIRVTPKSGNIDVESSFEIGYAHDDYIDSDPSNDKRTQITTIETAHLDINVTKEVNATTVNPGEQLTYTITVGNEGPANATELVIDDSVPEGTTFVSANPSNGTYDEVLGLWNIGELNASDTATLSLVVEVYDIYDVNNTASVSQVYQTDTDPSNDSASAHTQMNVADLSLTKMVNGEQNATINLGDEATYEINVTNHGISTATGVVLSDLLDVAQEYISHDTHGHGDYNESTGEWTIGDVNISDTYTLTIVAKPLEGGVAISNSIHIHSVDQPDTNLTANTASTTLTAAESDIKITIDVNQTSVALDKNITYIIRAENMGPSNATNVRVTDQLPAGAEYATHSATSGTGYSDSSSTWFIGGLANGQIVELNIIATMTQLGTITNEAHLSLIDQNDTNPSNNSDSVRVAVGGEADLFLTNIGDRVVATRGSDMVLKVSLENSGPDEATDINISDMIPEGMTYKSHTIFDGEYSGTVGYWSEFDLSNGATAELNITVTIDLNATDSITSTAKIIAMTQGDPDPIGDESSTTIQIIDMQIYADADSFSINGRNGGIAGDMTANDELNGVLLNDADVNATLTGDYNLSTIPSIDADGNLTIEANTTMGTYYIEYSICEYANPTNCSEANATVEVNASVIVADDDNNGSVNGRDGGVAIDNIVTNDSLDATANPVIGVDVNISMVVTSAGFSVDETNGSVTVAPETASGTYMATYKICENLNPTNCDEANITVVVDDAPIVANDDNFTAIQIERRYSGIAGDLTTNDTLNGVAVDDDDINITLIAGDTNITTTSTVNTNGDLIIAANTPKGTYYIGYKICEKLNTSNCNEANATVIIEQYDISAREDSNDTVYGRYGGVAIDNIAFNDKLENKELIVGLDVNIVAVSTDDAELDINTTNGEVVVASGTAVDDYSRTYKVCELLNPDNCGNSTIYVDVIATPIEALDDTNSSVNGRDGGVAIVNIIGNDTLGKRSITLDDVNITDVTDNHPEIDVNQTTGEVTVDPMTPAGDYLETYTICEDIDPTNCADANITITVVPAPIKANNDDFRSPEINGRTGGYTALVITSDTLNSEAVDISDINITLTGDSDLPSATLEANSSIHIASMTKMGTYWVEYEICEKLNPTNCSEANTTIKVKAVDIVANIDTNNSVIGRAGGTAVANIVANDTLDSISNPTIDADVNISNITTSDTKITIDASTGAVEIAPATPEGTYTGSYKLCEMLNPTNCDDANISVTVVAAELIANDEDFIGNPVKGSTGGFAGVVIESDKLDGSAVDSTDVNITLNGDDNISTTPILETNGSLSLEADTPLGTYYIGYKVCENLNPTNCKEANVTVLVVPAVLAANEINGTINGYVGGEVIANITTNDTIDDVSFTLGDEVNITEVSDSHPKVDLNLTTGKVTVEVSTPEGNYTETYKICENLNPRNCKEGNFTAIVTAALIVANDDNLTDTTINGRVGGVAGIVTTNDTLNGVDVNTSEITITTDSTIATVEENGTLVILEKTPMGIHHIEYKICENLNPTNCSEANATVDIDAAPIVANDDDFTATVIDGRVGGDVGVVTLNDKLNDENLSASDVNITLTTDTNITTAPIVGVDGMLHISAATKAGTYYIGYKICEDINPTNCSEANVTVVVRATDIVAVDDSGSVSGRNGGEAIANIVANDTLTGATGLIIGSDVNVSILSNDPELDINISDGSVSVASSTKSDTYTAIYKICENLNPTNCAEGNISVTVTSAPIVANDIDSNVSIDGYRGGVAIADVTVNDTLDGDSFTLGTSDTEVTIEDVVYSTGNGEIVLDIDTGEVTVSIGAPEGIYRANYVICENLNVDTDNCDDANITVEVSAAVIVANDDDMTSSPVSGKRGGAVGVVTDNDTIDGDPASTYVNAYYNGDSNLTGADADTIRLNGTLRVDSNTSMGTYYVGYKICEKINPANCSEANATIVVTQPLAEDDSASTPMDTNVSIAVLNNDYDPSGDKLEITSLSATSQGGVVSWTPSGTVIFEPSAGFVGDDTFSYTVGSPSGAASTATVTITVVDLNDSNTNTVTAVSDSSVTQIDTNVTIAVLDNDYDLEGDDFDISDVNASSREGGSIVIVGKQVTYSPPAGFEGTDMFAYTITDTNGSTDTATVKVTVAAAGNLPPNAVADKDYVVEGLSVTFNVLDNDSGDAIAVDSITNPANGTVSWASNGEMTYTPDANFTSTDSFMYTIEDNKSQIATATVTIRVTPAPDVFISDTNASEGNNLMFDVNLTSEYGADINLTLEITAGTATLGEDYEISTLTVLIPRGDLHTQAPVMALLDNRYERDENLTISVIAINSGLVKDHSDTAIGTIINADPMPSIYVGGGSVDEGNTHTVNINLSIPTNQDINITISTADGTATIANSDYIETNTTIVIPSGSMGGSISIRTIDDGIVEPDETITIIPMVNSGDINSTANGEGIIVNNDIPPVTVDDLVDGTWGEDTTIDVVHNDRDGTSAIDSRSVMLIDPVSGDAVTSVTVVGEGTWTVDASGSVLFIPVDGFVGDPTPVGYSLSDVLGNTATAMIEINYPPVAVDDSRLGIVGTSVNISVLDNDIHTNKPLDPSSVLLTNIDGQFMHDGKSMEIVGEGVWTAERNGTITFEPEYGFEAPTSPMYYTVSEIDSVGTADRSNAASVAIYYQMTLDDVYNTTGIAGTPQTVDILSNDGACIDPDTVTIINPDTNISVGRSFVVDGEGTWSVEANGSIKFTPVSADFVLDPSPIAYVAECYDGRVSGISRLTINYPLFARDDVSSNNPEGSIVILDGVLNDNGDINPSSVKINLPDGFMDLQPSAVLTSDHKWLTVPEQGKWKVLSNGTIHFAPLAGMECSPAPIEYSMADYAGNESNKATLMVTYNITSRDGPDSSGGDALGVLGMLLMILITGATGLYFIRREEQYRVGV